LSSSFDWAIIMDVGVGLGVLLIGIGVLVVCQSLAKLFARLNGTLDEIDRQVAALSAPVVETLGHVGGIADSADATVARLGAVVGTLERVAASVAGTAKLASDAVAPALVNVGATLTGVTAGVRRLVSGRRTPAPESETAGG
jgi:ABC-type transporter Mla subunit MlaD